MNGVKFSRRGFLHASAAFGLSAVAGPRSALAQTGRTLRFRSFTDIQNLDPPFRVTEPDSNVIDATLHRLISFEPGTEWKWQLDAAESIEQVDDTHIKFTLKPGIMWTNDFGEMTAEDVKYSFERAVDPALDAPYKNDWSALDHVEVTDKYSGVIVLKEFFAPLWWSTLPWHTASIVSKRAVESVGGKYTTEPPTASGPYLIT